MPELVEAKALLAEDKFAKAEPLVSRALEIAKYALGEHSLPYIEIVELQARCKFGRGQFSESAKLYHMCAQTYLRNSSFEEATRSLTRLSNSVLRLDDHENVSAILEFGRNIAHTGDVALNITISTVKMELLSVEYQRARIKKEEARVQALEKEFFELAKSVDFATLDEGSNVVCGWWLAVARWKQTIYDTKRDEKVKQEAIEAYNSALKASAKDDREAELIRADAQLGLGDLARLDKKWTDADEYYKKAVEATDKYFDRDSPRVRRVIEREALVQYHLNRWLHAEGLLRRLMDYYNEHTNALSTGICPRAQYDCCEAFVAMLENRGRTTEAQTIKTRLSAVTTILPTPIFDPLAHF